jgi:hypothetical protein
MNVQRDPDAILAAWLEEGPSALPEASRRAIAVNTRTTNQRGHPIWVPRRRLSMNPFARIAVAAVAVVAVLGGAIYIFTPSSGVGGGPPGSSASPPGSPSASARVSASPPAASPSPLASPAVLADSGDIFQGAYVPRFDPSLTFSIDQELLTPNCYPGYQCRGNIDANFPGWLYLEFGQPAIEIGIVRVDKLNDPAHPGRLIDPPADLAAWIASRPGLTVIAQKAVTVGGLAGTQLDVQTGNKDVQFGPIPGVTDPPSGLGANLVYRLFIVRVDGHLVLISVLPGNSSLEALQPFVDSIVWN